MLLAASPSCAAEGANRPIAGRAAGGASGHSVGPDMVQGAGCGVPAGCPTVACQPVVSPAVCQPGYVALAPGTRFHGCTSDADQLGIGGPSLAPTSDRCSSGGT